MISKLFNITFFGLSLFLCPLLGAQDINKFTPDISRALYHDYVDREQLIALRADGTDDQRLTISDKEEINFLLTDALTRRVDELQNRLEKDSGLSHQIKVRYIRGLEEILKYVNADKAEKREALFYLPQILEGYQQCLELDRLGKRVDAAINSMNYAAAVPVVRSKAFDLNASIQTCRDILIRKYCELHPDETFSTLRQNPDVPFADSLIRIVAYKYPRQLYDYSAAGNKLGALIRKIDDPLIQAVSKMSTSGGSGQLYFAFLDNIVKGKITLKEIDEVKDDQEKYYRLLVKTRIDYVKRAIEGDTAMEFRALTDMLEKKAVDVFVNTINGLHDLEDPVRFKILQSLTAEELYYLAVLSDGIIYTSSYVRGVFPLMMQRVNNRSDSLLQLVMFDKFRKFIKVAAGYNTLNTFLNGFPDKQDAQTLMTAFVNGLENSAGLEEGVDVADSYTSIAEGNKELASYVLDLTRLNYERNRLRNNKRGMVIYDLLNKLFLSADTASTINISKEFGIPPVYNVNHVTLANDSNRVIMQVMFYGDKDGQNIFVGFQRMFDKANWDIVSSPYWIAIHSKKGSPVSIYANRPLDEETGEDEKAQKELSAYLRQNNLHPSIVIHRGHSYYAPYTIEQIQPSAKIVFMGSCGGYHLINDILKKAPDAHIIASKQIGKTAINRPFFSLLMEKVRNGNNIDWIPFWKEFEKSVYVEGFEDYIPPHKNLGAIFIKGYKTAMGEKTAG